MYAVGPETVIYNGIDSNTKRINVFYDILSFFFFFLLFQGDSCLNCFNPHEFEFLVNYRGVTYLQNHKTIYKFKWQINKKNMYKDLFQYLFARILSKSISRRSRFLFRAVSRSYRYFWRRGE